MSMDLAFALRGYEVSNTAKVIYGVLDGLSRASARKGLPYTYIGQRAIAEKVGVCEKTVRTAIKQLREAGLILVKRRGRGLNNACYVLSPSMKQEEREAKTSAYRSRTVKKSHSNTITKDTIKQDSKTIYPLVSADNAASPQIKNSGITAPKGKATPKRPHRNIQERQRMKHKYKEYLISKLKLEEFKDDLLSHGDDIRALENIIELISNTMANKGKIAVNGALMLPSQWWYVVKNLNRDTVLDIIYEKIPHFKSVKNYRAYLLATIYNSAMEGTLFEPWYSYHYGENNI